MKQTNNVSPVGEKPPAVGVLTHPVTHSSSVHPQTLRGQFQPPSQVRPSQIKPQQALPKPLQVQPAQKQSDQNPPKFLNQTKHRGAQAVTSAAPGEEPKLLDQVSEVLRTKHYSIRTEKAYNDWIYLFIIFIIKSIRAKWGWQRSANFSRTSRWKSTSPLQPKIRLCLRYCFYIRKS